MDPPAIVAGLLAVLAVAADRTPSELLSAMLEKAPDHLILTPLGIRGSQVAVRVRFTAPPARLDPGADRWGASEPALIDTTGPNRY